MKLMIFNAQKFYKSVSDWKWTCGSLSAFATHFAALIRSLSTSLTETNWNEITTNGVRYLVLCPHLCTWARTTLRKRRGGYFRLVHRHVTTSWNQHWLLNEHVATQMRTSMMTIFMGIFRPLLALLLTVPTAIFKASFRCNWCYGGLCSSCSSCSVCYQTDYLYDVGNVLLIQHSFKASLRG